MILWNDTPAAIGYASSRASDAADILGGYPDQDAMALAMAALTEAIAALVLIGHTRKGDQLVTIDQLHAETTPAAQPLRICCQTYPAELHAQGCYGVLAYSIATATKP